MKKAKKIILIIFITLLILILGGAGAVYGYLKHELSPVGTAETQQEVKFMIPYGTSAYEVTKELKKQNLIRNDKLFYKLLLRPKYLYYIYSDIEFPESLEFKSGMYIVKNTMNYGEIIELFASGKKETIKISIPEGLTISKIAKIMEENEICKKEDFISACHDEKVLSKLNIEADSVEGFLFPDTYFFDFGMKADQVVERLVNNFYKHLNEIEELRDKNFNDLYKTIILASIVEREYKVKDEAPLIASVFTNRLKINMGLQSCATVEYIITEIQGKPHPDRIFNSDLQIDNPYNTYMWRGLPPGPISNPGMTSLKASANPPKTEYYFFQVADEAAGRHVFTKTFNDHRKNHILLGK